MLAVIPLRSGSKRLKDKNVFPFYGKPIFKYPLRMAVGSGLFDKVIVALDKEYTRYIDTIGDGGGVYVPYVRAQQNSRDESPLIDLVKEVVKEYNITDNEMCILYSTSVLTTIGHLKKGIERLRQGDVNCVFPVVEQNNELSIQGDDYCFVTKDEYFDNYARHGDAWFLFNVKEILESGKIIQGTNGFVELSELEYQSVHNESDMELLKRKYFLKENYNE